MSRLLCTAAMYGTLYVSFAVSAVSAEGEQEDGFMSLFNGKDFTGWKVPDGDNGHWRVVDGVIDYDAASESKGDGNLWTVREYGDFILKIDWRIKQTSGVFKVPIVLQDGTHLQDANGKKLTIEMPNADSGIFVRGAVALQHHGGVNTDGSYKPASSLVQFRNVWIKELDSAE